MRIPSMNEVYDKAVLTKQLAALILVILFSVTGVFAQETNPKQLNWEKVRNELILGDVISQTLFELGDQNLSELYALQHLVVIDIYVLVSLHPTLSLLFPCSLLALVPSLPTIAMQMIQVEQELLVLKESKQQ